MRPSSRYDRRAFLRSLGAGAALLPMLDTERSARAAGKAPVRLLVIVKSNGNLSRTVPTLGVTQEFYPTPASGTSLAGAAFPAVTEPLAPFRDYLLFPQNMVLQQHVDNPRTGDFNHHNWGMLLTGEVPLNDRDAGGHGAGPSIDHHIAEALAPPTPIRNLTLGVRTPGVGDGRAAVSWRGAKVANVPESNPTAVFDRLFAGRAPTGGDQAAAFERLRRERKSVLDFLGDDLTRFSARLGTEHKMQIEAHLASVREIERELAAMPSSGVACTIPTKPSGIDASNWRKFDVILKAQLDLLAAGFACDATRVATLSLGDAGAGSLVFEWLGKDFLGPRLTDNAGGTAEVTNYHDITHAVARAGSMVLDKAGSDQLRRKRAVERWHMEQLAYLLGLLKSRVDVDGKPLLDNMIVLWVDSLALGWHHTKVDMPWLIAGKGGGHFKAGHVVKVGGDGFDQKVPTNGLLVEVANAMGVPTSSFGDYSGAMPLLRA